MRVALKALRSRRLMTQQYQNNYLLSRISGFAFDIMIVSAISTIEVSDLRGLWLPYVLMVVAGAACTLLHLRFVCKRAYPEYYYEGLVSMYGMMTGTISSGVLLLREIDPHMKTPAANNLVLGSTFGIVLGAPIMVLVGLAAKSMTMAIATLGICVVYYCAMVAIVFIGRKKAQ
jgi:ESS family glutamate:Na+ symporter